MGRREQRTTRRVEANGEGAGGEDMEKDGRRASGRETKIGAG